MGIKDYLKYLENEDLKRKYNNLYLDGNFMIHYFIYKCKNDKNLYLKTNYFFDLLFDNLKITDNIFIIFDGKSDLNDPKYLTKQLRSKNKIISDDYDKQYIYYNSEIITRYKNILIKILENKKKIDNLNYKILINDNRNEGEGDFKIYNEIKKNNHNKICIISKDSDMVLLAYSLIKSKNIEIDLLINLRENKIININNLINTFNNIDYILIVMLLGNDYLPKISNITYDKLIKSYNKYINFNEKIIINNIINYNNFTLFITYLLLIEKKIKFNIKKLDYYRFNIYINNLNWCLKNYGVLNNDNNYIQFDNITNVINIYNFINYKV